MHYSNQSTARLGRHDGFTMIELMVTIAMLAILLGIGIPSFQSMFRNSRITTQTNSLVTSFALARSEATKRGNVSICARSGNQCSGTTNWETGWLVFTDQGVAGQLDGNDQLLKEADAASSAVTITSVDALNPNGTTTPAAAFVTYTSLGSTTGGISTNSAQFEIEQSGCGKNEMRVVTISSSGRSNLARRDCG